MDCDYYEHACIGVAADFFSRVPSLQDEAEAANDLFSFQSDRLKGASTIKPFDNVNVQTSDKQNVEKK